MTDIMIMAAFDDYPELMATGSAISLVASVSLLLSLHQYNLLNQAKYSHEHAGRRPCFWSRHLWVSLVPRPKLDLGLNGYS